MMVPDKIVSVIPLGTATSQLTSYTLAEVGPHVVSEVSEPDTKSTACGCPTDMPMEFDVCVLAPVTFNVNA